MTWAKTALRLDPIGDQTTNIFLFSRFGVCCLFLITATGSTINQNCTYLRNPSFPSVYSSTSSLSYTVSKCSTGE